MKNSLVRRNIGLLVGVVLAGQLLAGLMVVALVLRPQTMRVADISARMLNAVSVTMEDQDRATQDRIVRQINMDGGIHIRPINDPPDSSGRAYPNLVERIFMLRLADQLSAQDSLLWRTDAAGHLWMQITLGGTLWWINMTPPRMAGPMMTLFYASLIAFLVAAVGGLLLQRRIDQPLRALSDGAAAYQPGSTSPRITVDGPSEIAAVAHAFNVMADRIDAHEQERALMLAGVSHDLRTPLARLRLVIEMMPGDDEDLRESAHRQVEQLDRMLGQFLSFARTGEDENRELIDLATLVQSASEDTGLGDQIVLQVEQGLSALVRPLAMQRAIQNLLENASRYGTPPVMARAFREAEKAVIIEIIDQGEGFDPELADQFVKPFAQGETSRTGDGTGLGLAIAHKHVVKEGGKLVFARGQYGFVARIELVSS